MIDRIVLRSHLCYCSQRFYKRSVQNFVRIRLAHDKADQDQSLPYSTIVSHLRRADQSGQVDAALEVLKESIKYSKQAKNQLKPFGKTGKSKIATMKAMGLDDGDLDKGSTENLMTNVNEMMKSHANLAKSAKILQSYTELCKETRNPYLAFEALQQYKSHYNTRGWTSVPFNARDYALDAAIDARNVELCKKIIDASTLSKEVLRAHKLDVFMKLSVVIASAVVVGKWGILAAGALVVGPDSADMASLGPISLGLVFYAGLAAFWVWIYMAFRKGGPIEPVAWTSSATMWNRFMQEDMRKLWEKVVLNWDRDDPSFNQILKELESRNLCLGAKDEEDSLIV